MNERSHKKTVKSLGYVDELEKVYPDPIAYFTKVVKEVSEKEKTAKTELTMTFAVGETMDFDADNRKNIGYMPFSHLYRELKIDAFFTNRQRSLNVDFKLDHIFRL
ncbi:MAG TPA: transposase, partial [Clostridia bacterium]|nr:transposase [Clostridia bacterium]